MQAVTGRKCPSIPPGRGLPEQDAGNTEGIGIAKIGAGRWDLEKQAALPDTVPQGFPVRTALRPLFGFIGFLLGLFLAGLRLLFGTGIKPTGHEAEHKYQE